ncbi:SDR family oxidoreductase [Azoarcus sp. L1K30]|nr:SDR family oxidoreductase [Azoarcus sp. L1K30]MBR0566997.1 SDR family oxidoreductase [Azoarcus sp. L1K30]
MPQRVFITGASSGLGAALARHYAGQGAVLGLVARREAPMRRLIDELSGTHRIFVADVANAQSIQAAAKSFVDDIGLPDVVIANAGVSVGTLTEHAEDIDAFARLVQINLIGMVATFQPFIEGMRQRGSGRLAGIASVAGIRGLPGAGAYSASKAGALAYLESLRVELHGSGVKVVTVAPGYIRTPMTAVNTYPMPFMLEADIAAARIVRIIERGDRFAVTPWQMAWVAKLLRVLPRGLYDRLFAHAGRKPRGLPL